MTLTLDEYETSESYYHSHPCMRVRQLWLVYSTLACAADEQRDLDIDEWVERAKRELENEDSDWSRSRSAA